jgi:hypothetical protein
MSGFEDEHEGNIAFIEDFCLEPYRPDRGEPAQLCCGDPRQPAEDDVILGRQPYRQILGGAYGLVNGLAVAMEMRQPGSFIDLDISLEEFGVKASEPLAEHHLLIFLHEGCRYIKFHREIAAARATIDGDVYETAQQFRPGGINDATYETFTESSRRLLMTGLHLKSSDQVYKETRRKGEASDGLSSAILEPTNPPQPRGFVVIEDNNTIFRVNRANAANRGYYVSTFGILGKVAAAISKSGRGEFRVNGDDLLDALAIDAAILREQFLLGQDGQKLPIYRFRDGAAVTNGYGVSDRQPEDEPIGDQLTAGLSRG